MLKDFLCCPQSSLLCAFIYCQYRRDNILRFCPHHHSGRWFHRWDHSIFISINPFKWAFLGWRRNEKYGKKLNVPPKPLF